LLQSGASAFIKDHDGRLPLHWATDNPNPDVLNVLLKKVANADIK
jgi:ankyrin repeat protein